MSEIDQRTLSLTATCHNADCPNGDVTITLEYDATYPPQAVVCGPCGRTLADVTGLPA